jgi:DNA-binding transcriptional ArsR family regulator
MTGKPTLESPPTEIFSALSDPVRWSIIAQAAQVDELACMTLESTLRVAKPTISYHVKILRNAGLINTRKEGRNYYYSLRRDVIEDLMDRLWELAPTPRAVADGQQGSATRRRPRRQDHARRTTVTRQRAGSDATEEAVVLTW